MKASKYTKETIRELGMSPRNFPHFEVGDTIEVSQLIKEGDKQRTQLFEGDVLAMRSNGVSSTFTVRRIGANGVAVERVFPLYSPLVQAIKFVRRGDVRRAKLFYMRDRVGKAARVKERILTKDQKAEQAASGSAQ